MGKEYQNDLQISFLEKADSIIEQLPRFTSRFFESLRNQGMSERTIVQYAFDTKSFFDWLSPALSCNNVDLKTCNASILDDLTIDDINDYFKTIRTVNAVDKLGNAKRKLSSPSYRARKASSLRSFFKYYYRIGETKNGLGDLIEVPKIPEQKIIVIEKDDISRLLNAITDCQNMSKMEISRHKRIEKRDYAIMMLFLGTGIRVSELVGLDVGDFDFYSSSFVVTRKGGDEDEVFFSEEVKNALEDYLKDCRDKLLKEESEETAFFVSGRGDRLTVSSVEKLVKKYGIKAGLNVDLHPHSLRKSFGTYLYEESGDIYLVASALHHSSVETTKKHYANMSKDHKRSAAQISSGMFENK